MYLHVPRYLDFYLTAIHAEKSEKIAKSVWMPGDVARREGSHKSVPILFLTFLRAHCGGCFGVTVTLLNSFAANPRRAESKVHQCINFVL